MKILVVIPARGGSKGIPRKNVRFLAGQPLLSYTIICSKQSKYNVTIVVTTDDEEISRVASLYGADVIKRPDELGKDAVTLDPVIYHAVITQEEKAKMIYDVVITIQPTSPLLKSTTLDDAIANFLECGYDTVLSGVNSPHLSWTEFNGEVKPNYEKRLNRQELPKHLMETGAFFITKREYVKPNNRFGPKVSIYEVPDSEAIDIDTPQDWWIAEKELQKKNIVLRVEGYAEIGLGHIYRGLLLAYNLIDHNIIFVLSEKSDLGIVKIQESFFPYKVIKNDDDMISVLEEFNCDILINDMLDTSAEYITNCKSAGVRVVNMEDLGEGVKIADAVINDLYEKKNDLPNHFWGSEYYCIRDEFLLAKQKVFVEKVQEILIIFGGTDPSNLTQKLFDIIKTLDFKDIKFTFILGMGYKHTNQLQLQAANLDADVEIVQNVKSMADYMARADLAISSQGRTMLELASMGVPTVLLAQNERELHHEFGYLKNGFINLGLGREVSDITVKNTLIWLVNSPQIRKQMKEQMSKRDLKKGIDRVKDIILNTRKDGV